MLTVLLALIAATPVPPGERTAIFEAAGFKPSGRQWKSGNCDGMESASYGPGAIDTFRDLNGDDRPDAVVSESGAICYGDAGTHFWLLSKQANGAWKLIYNETGMPEFLATTGAGGWPDVQIGGPGFCFSVMRWNGREYRFNRSEYDGKRCQP